jgi:dehydrodolichyl diphosphate syntase complex subunit NUS1
MILWCFVRKKYEILWNKSDIPDDLYYITNCVKNLKNVPSHLAFILVNEDLISIEDLSNLVVWSLAAGVSFLSFYDQEGEFQI